VDQTRNLDPAIVRAAEQLIEFDPQRLVRALHGTSGATARLLGTGVGAAPGAASGPIATSFDAALDAADRHESPVLIVEETGPADEPAMRVASAVVTARGGLASHAAVVARAWGLPAVCGLSGIRIEGDAVWFDDVRLAEGSWVSVDGATGEVRLGAADHGAATGLDEDLREVLSAGDHLVGGCPAVWANAETAAEVATAVDLGAMGVGLCRTEHQFLGDRIGSLQSLLLGADRRSAAAGELAEQQRSSIAAVLGAANGIPVVVRLLDPPLHEFLPAPEDDRAPADLRDLAKRWREHNPMLGVRGVRLAAVAPAVLEAQVSGVIAALGDTLESGVPCDLRVLVPMVSWPTELDWVVALVAAEAVARSIDPPPVGAMVETPSAALGSAALAQRAAFLSIGSNDLTQLVLGLSRDDSEVRVIEEYRTRSVLDASPFETLDPAVVDLVALAVDRAPGVSWGLCGEHGADAASLRRLARVPLDYVSCSPYRVPVARLALGQIAAAKLLGPAST